MIRKQLAGNFKECIAGGRSEESARRYRNAVELYYKGFVALCDIVILDEFGDIPNFHKERDRLLGELNGAVNDMRIGLHTMYRRSYYMTDFTADDCREIKNAIKTAITLRKPGKDLEAAAQAL